MIRESVSRKSVFKMARSRPTPSVPTHARGQQSKGRNLSFIYTGSRGFWVSFHSLGMMREREWCGQNDGIRCQESDVSHSCSPPSLSDLIRQSRRRVSYSFAFLVVRRLSLYLGLARVGPSVFTPPVRVILSTAFRKA